MSWSLSRINFAGVALKEGEKFEYVIIYEDKDRDWMLVGDVPWQYVYITLHYVIIFCLYYYRISIINFIEIK